MLRRAHRDHALLGARCLLVTAGASERRVKAMHVQRLLQRLDVLLVHDDRLPQLRDSLAKKDAVAELTFVAFTPGPRTVTLEVSRRQGERVRVAGRELRADLYTLHPKIPFPISIFVHPKDARLWFTHGAPPALLRAEQNLIEKDDPQIRIDVIPAGPALPSPAARRGPRPRR